LRATVQRFLGDFYVEEDLLTDFERRGISSEWDMAPLIIASYWDYLLSRQPMPNLPEDVSAAAWEIEHRRKVEAPKRLSIPAFSLVPGQYPAETAFRSGCFPAIPERLRKKLLTGTRDVRRSATMRVFQHFTLGSKTFSHTYQLPAEFEAESVLLAQDKANISEAVRVRLERSGYPLAVFTARPSRPPREVHDSIVGYAPEAEMALALIGMENVPLLAFGKLAYIASQHQLDPEALVKPSPFHALAASLAAWTGGELSALQAAYTWYSVGALNGHFDKLPRSFELVVVEDTLGGIRSARAAGDIFRTAGFEALVRPVGLTSGIAAKAAAFEAAGVPHFEGWDELLTEMGL
jgi:hypothetical protein